MSSRIFVIMVLLIAPGAFSASAFGASNTNAAQLIASDVSTPKVGLELVAEGFTAPMELVSPGDGTGRMFLVDQIGLIKIILANGTVVGEPFLDVSDRMVK
jgi:hypothetical protein